MTWPIFTWPDIIWPDNPNPIDTNNAKNLAQLFTSRLPPDDAYLASIV